jgi:nitroreductase / dihydropteridine reductase
MTKIIDALNWRYAAKAYDTAKKLDDAQISTLLEAIRLTPSSFGLPTYKVIHVKDAETREKLKAVAWGQSQVTDASDLFVFAAKTNIGEADVEEYMNEVSKVRGIPVEGLAEYAAMIKGSIASRTAEENAIWTAKQAYIALGVLLSAAALEEIDSTPMEGFDAKQFDEILGLTELGLTATVICPVGYRAEGDAYATLPKVRMPIGKTVIEK